MASSDLLMTELVDIPVPIFKLPVGFSIKDFLYGGVGNLFVNKDSSHFQSIHCLDQYRGPYL